MRRWPAQSVRMRLTLWYAGALTVVLVLYAAGVFLFLWRSLSTELDRRLHDDFEVAEQMVERTTNGGIRWRSDDTHEDELSDDAGVEVWAPEGTLLYHSESLEGGAPLFSLPPMRPSGYRSLSLSTGLYVRVLSRPYTVDGLLVVIRVARSETRLRQELGELFLVLGLGLPVAVGIAGGGGYILAR